MHGGLAVLDGIHRLSLGTLAGALGTLICDRAGTLPDGTKMVPEAGRYQFDWVVCFTVSTHYFLKTCHMLWIFWHDDFHDYDFRSLYNIDLLVPS